MQKEAEAAQQRHGWVQHKVWSCQATFGDLAAVGTVLDALGLGPDSPDVLIVGLQALWQMHICRTIPSTALGLLKNQLVRQTALVFAARQCQSGLLAGSNP